MSSVKNLYFYNKKSLPFVELILKLYFQSSYEIQIELKLYPYCIDSKYAIFAFSRVLQQYFYGQKAYFIMTKK